MKIAIINLGCKVNQCECDSIAARMMSYGYEVVQEFVPADVYVINTCAVTQEAEKKSRQCVARVRKYNPDAKVYVIGCASQKNPEQFANKGVTYIGGCGNKQAVCELGEGVHVEPLPTTFETLDFGKGTHARECVKIQDGCNNFCSYCIVPYLRGRARSRSIDDILCECRLRALTAHEIVLTGINVSAYGKDIGSSLVELVRALKGIPVRFRFGSLEAGVIEPKLLRAMKDGGHFCPHFHLSLQSGSDEVLRAMNRHYTAKEFAGKVALIRDYFPLAAITTDVIVGFATETKEQFEESLAFVESMGFAGIHVFPYSRRQGTKAYSLAPIPADEMNERVARMTKVKEASAKAFIHSFIGYELEVVTETADGMYMQGHTENYIKIYLPSAETCKVNQKYRVRCVAPYQDGMLAERI